MPNDNVLTPERRFHFANRMIHIDNLEDRIALVRAIEREVLAAHPGQPEPRAEVKWTDEQRTNVDTALTYLHGCGGFEPEVKLLRELLAALNRSKA